jgi:hypothetical protein
MHFCFAESQARSGWWPVRLAGRAESRQTTGTARDELTVTEVRGRAVLRRAGTRKSGGAVVSPVHYGPLMGCWPWAGECSTYF